MSHRKNNFVFYFVLLNLKLFNTYQLGTLIFFNVQMGNIYSFSTNIVVFAIVACQAG